MIYRAHGRFVAWSSNVGFQVTEFSKQAAVRHELRKRIIKRFRAEGIGVSLTRAHCVPARARHTSYFGFAVIRERWPVTVVQKSIQASLMPLVRSMEFLWASTVFDDHHHAGIEICGA